MADIINFPARLRAVPEAIAEDVAAFQAVHDALPTMSDEAALALLREQGEREAEEGNYDPDCDCRDCRGERLSNGDLHICADDPADNTGFCHDCMPVKPDVDDFGVTVEEGYDPDGNCCWAVKRNGCVVVEVWPWENASSGYHPPRPCDSFALAEYMAEALRAYTGPLEDR